jgi:hypothetical protein
LVKPIRSASGASVWLVARSRLRRHWVGIVVVGIVGALAGAGVLATVSGARRSDTAYERLRIATRAFDGRALFPESFSGTASARVTRFRLLPEVGESTVARFRVGRRADTKDWISTISLPALDAAASRPQIIRGRSFRLGSPNEAVLSQETAKVIGLDVGDELPIDFYSDRQFSQVLNDYFVSPGGESVRLRIVGITRDPDDASGARAVYVGQTLLQDSESTAGFAGVLFRLAPGATRAQVEDRLASPRSRALVPDVVWASDTGQTLDNTRNAITSGLLVAAGAWALAGIIALLQAAARQVDQDAAERRALLALGFSARQRIAVATIPGVLAALVALVGSLAGAVALSPFFPTGRLHAFEPHPGWSVNIAMFAIGAVLVLAAVVGAFAFAAWRAERRVATYAHQQAPPRLAPHAEHWDFGATTLLGVRFAVERGSENNAVPVRTTILGIAAAVMGVVAALTFAASLQEFIDTPAQYGQPWDLSIETLGDADAPLLLAADHDVQSAARVRSLDATVDRHATAVNTVQALKGELTPTIESGRMPDRSGEIALGPKLLETIDAKVGDEVVVRSRATRTLRVVGTALNLDPQDESFGTTAYVTRSTFVALRGNGGLVNEETVLHLRPEADAAVVHRRLKIATPLGLTDESLPTRPAAVANVAEIGKVPTMLAVVLGIIGMVAVAHAVVLAVRRRRRALAVLAALGMTQGQRLRIVLAMATTMILLGLTIGIPLGLLLGSYVWNLMATGLRVGFEANVPVLGVCGVALAGIALTLLVALLPARDAARVRPAPLLRAG